MWDIADWVNLCDGNNKLYNVNIGVFRTMPSI